MTHLIHFIVSRSRAGWAVSIDADLLSEHADVQEARDEAVMLADLARRDGCAVSFLDLSATDASTGSC
jgi:hypothetical protein